MNIIRSVKNQKFKMAVSKSYTEIRISESKKIVSQESENYSRARTDSKEPPGSR
jgi:hypothetical protein